MTVRIARFFLVCSLWALALGVGAADTITPPRPTQPLLTEHYTITGASEAAVVQEARVRAIESAIGRIYFTDYMLRARDLLGPYIEKNGERFIARTQLNVNEIRGGRRFMDIEVVVDCEKLYADLHEKRFIYRPAFRPLFYIFMEESFDGKNVAEQTGRKHLLAMMNSPKALDGKPVKRPYRYLWNEPIARAENADIPAAQKKETVLPVPSPYDDPTSTPASLAVACREAQRSEVEVFIAGSLRTATRQSKEIYFDTFTYVETACNLSLVRADTGEVLARASASTSAANRDPEEARRTAAIAALDKVAPQLFDAFDKRWDKMILRKANLRIMTIGKQDNELSVLKEIVAGVGRGVEMYERCSFANVGVLTVSWDGKTADLIQMLRLGEHPKIHMVYTKPDGLILEII